MKATELKRMYPEVWDSVYGDMITDLKSCMSGASVEQYEIRNPHNLIDRIAHNAAFLACMEVYKTRKAIKNSI